MKNDASTAPATKRDIQHMMQSMEICIKEKIDGLELELKDIYRYIDLKTGQLYHDLTGAIWDKQDQIESKVHNHEKRITTMEARH